MLLLTRIPSKDFRLERPLAAPHRLGAVAGVNAHVLRGEVAGPVACAGRAGVQVHHDGHMAR